MFTFISIRTICICVLTAFMCWFTQSAWWILLFAIEPLLDAFYLAIIKIGIKEDNNE